MAMELRWKCPQAARRRGSVRFGGLIATACAAAALGSSASATVLVATYQGEIADGTDGALFFGGGNLTGDAVTEKFTYDTSLGVRSTNAEGDSVNGGPVFGTPSIYRSVTVTINGVTVAVPTGDLSSDHGNDDFQYELPFASTTYVYDQLNDSSGDNLEGIVYAYNPPASIETPFSGSGSIRGGGDLYRDGLQTSFGLDYGGTVNIALAAPEPSAWLLMVLGFGGLGLAARVGRARNGSMQEA